MIVPQFWAEARVQQPRGMGRQQITVRRFGWSDVSAEEAVAMAEARTREAFDRVARGEKLQRREPRVAYNGAKGVPIREEILARHGDAVITRNAYGAHCLNTPNVLFADIDFAPETACRPVLLAALPLLVGAVALGIVTRSILVFAIGAILALILAYPLFGFWRRLVTALRGGVESSARRRVLAFIRKRPDWGLRLYRTPAGFRVLATHTVIPPDDPAVQEFFSALHVDSVYARMCRNQQCFRARLTAKPWRIGVAHHMRPRPGVWPVKPERMAEREAWIREYEAVADRFAACRFVETFGSDITDSRVRPVCELHDRLSRAHDGLEIA